MIISFEATDVFLFYIFFEAMLIPMYFLIGGFGDRAHGSYQSAATAAGATRRRPPNGRTRPSSSCSTTWSAASSCWRP